jgi:hypothetical protein
MPELILDARLRVGPARQNRRSRKERNESHEQNRKPAPSSEPAEASFHEAEPLRSEPGTTERDGNNES